MATPYGGAYLIKIEYFYQVIVLQYHSAVKADMCRVKKELVAKENLVKQRQLVKMERDRTKSVPDAIYEIGVLPPQYHNLVAVTSFLDDFDTGRCHSLTGPEGVYAAFEDDLRFKRIERRLDVVIAKLDEIASNQPYIVKLMREANATLSRIDSANKEMMKDIDKIKENAELTAYHTQCTAQSNAVMERIMRYRTTQCR